MRARSSSEPVLQYALRLLSYKGRSEKELAMRLRMKGFDEASVESAIARLRTSGFLDDRRLAGSLRRYAEERKHLSIAATRGYLREKGISRDLADQVTTDMDEREVARSLVEKRLISWERQGTLQGHGGSAAALKRLYGILIRKGFPHETIRAVLDEFDRKGG